MALRRYRKHPKWAFRDPTTHALEPVYSVHYNDYAAKLQGAQVAYDVGIQRTSWGIHALTNWMGDAGRLKSLTGQYRSHVYLSDVIRLGGKVEGKEVDALTLQDEILDAMSDDMRIAYLDRLAKEVREAGGE